MIRIIPKAIFYLLKGDYTLNSDLSSQKWTSKPNDKSTSWSCSGLSRTEIEESWVHQEIDRPINLLHCFFGAPSLMGLMGNAVTSKNPKRLPAVRRSGAFVSVVGT